MKKKEMIQEHKRLVKVLTAGKKKDLQKEAAVQKKELEKLLKKKKY